MAITIRVDEIPRGGVDLSREIDAPWMARYLCVPYRPGSDAVAVLASVRRVADDVFVRCHVRASVLFDCSLCAEEARTEADFEFDRVFVPDGRTEPRFPEDIDADVETLEILTYRGRVIEIDDALGENLVTALDPYPKCRPECLGLCPTCHGNRNVGECTCSGEIRTKTNGGSP